MQLVAVNTLNERIGEITHSLYYISIDLILYYIIMASTDYTYYEVGSKSIIKVIRLIIGIDTVILLLNNFNHALFRYTTRIGMNGQNVDAFGYQ